ncbi:hypothetical protein IV203_000248 [Nitzschia inconspicua]|uniref:Uncharacterized protein n=1 Tax=Nitzschia inconspicua TaxID=303405 RepID=A0A9K3L4X2_9STRA|nr:hypothetical protein IV203_000248 [Nitzschia inconspicua]
MSDSRRRSTRRVKKRTALYAVNDLVQVPRSNTTLIGRLVAQISDAPSSRWLVAFENHKDEVYAEETLGRVVGRMEEDPDASDEDQGASPVHNASGDVGDAGNDIEYSKTVNEVAETSVRSTKRRSTTSLGGSVASKTGQGDANSSGESSPAEDATTESNSKKKKRAVTFSSRSRSNSEGSAVFPSPSKKDKAFAAGAPTETLSGKVSDREHRSRRRQAMTEEEILQASLEASKNQKLNGNKRILTSGNASGIIKDPPPPIGPKNKKAKVGNGGKGGDDVLKVKLLTGTLFLSRGIHRHVEFVPRI